LFTLLFYGPVPAFRELWITTAMHTSHCKFLAQWLYTNRYIAHVLNENRIQTDKKTDEDMITVEIDNVVYFAEVQGNHYKGFLIKVNDPSHVTLAVAQTNTGETLEEFVGRTDSRGGINASGFYSDKYPGIADGYYTVDGRITQSKNSRSGQTHTICGMDYENRLIVGSYTEKDLNTLAFRWAVEFGPILIVNGEKTTATKMSGGIAPRTAIGQTQDGSILLLAVDGRSHKSLGATFLDLQTIMFANGAINAMVLDGGSSTTMMYENQVVNDAVSSTRRSLPNAILF